MNQPDENSAPPVASALTRASYHCPSTMCDGHFYLAESELGRKLLCPKCGLSVVIGNSTETATQIDAGSGMLKAILLFALGMMAGFLLSLALR